MHNNMQIVTYGTMFPTPGKWSNPLTANHINAFLTARVILPFVRADSDFLQLGLRMPNFMGMPPWLVGFYYPRC